MNHKIMVTGHRVRGSYRWRCSCGRTSKKSWGTPGLAEAAGSRHIIDAHQPRGHAVTRVILDDPPLRTYPTMRSRVGQFLLDDGGQPFARSPRWVSPYKTEGGS